MYIPQVPALAVMFKSPVKLASILDPRGYEVPLILTLIRSFTFDGLALHVALSMVILEYLLSVFDKLKDPVADD